ncbi:MAG: carboxypeptidase regulatory-like domain-containing protein [Myxococcales bacterium FL481]|nr:MAG: carboxypeptidase regulatory-like domain-containing protein [Myxococcales bacterium FL481]
MDETGEPVSGGVLLTYCLDGERAGSLRPGVPLTLRDDGSFAGVGCRGRMCLVLQHPGYLPADPWVVAAGEEVTLTARALVRLTGTVRDQAGRPVAGASVRLGPLPGEEDPTALPAYIGARAGQRTTADGHFGFTRVERPLCDVCGEVSGRCDPATHDVLPSYLQMRLVVSSPGYNPVHRAIDVESDRELEITLTASLTSSLRPSEDG